MADFFQDLNSSYRVFIRTAPRGWGGSAFLGSYILEYSDTILDEADAEVTSLLAHEMVHSFTAMSNEENGEENAWYREGKLSDIASLSWRLCLILSRNGRILRNLPAIPLRPRPTILRGHESQQ